MSFEIAPVGFSKPVAEVGAAGFSSIAEWQDYENEQIETAEDIDNIFKNARENNENMKDIFKNVVEKMKNYIKDIKEEDLKRKKEDKFLDQVFQEKMKKTMVKFKYFEAKINENNIDIESMIYFNEFVNLYVQTKNKKKENLKVQNQKLRKKIKGQRPFKPNTFIDGDSTDSEGESEVEPAKQPTNSETDSDSGSDSSLSETDPDSEDD